MVEHEFARPVEAGSVDHGNLASSPDRISSARVVVIHDSRSREVQADREAEHTPEFALAKLGDVERGHVRVIRVEPGTVGSSLTCVA